MLSSDHKWDKHIKKACKKAIKDFFMIKRIVSNIYWTTKLNLYKSMIVPIIYYGSPCYWLSKNIMVILEKVQKRIVKWISSIGGRYKACLKFLGILPLSTCILVNNFLLLSKKILGRYDNELIDMPFYTDSSRCNLFQLQRPRKRFLEENFFYQTDGIANFVKIHLSQKNCLKKPILRVLWRRFEQYEELKKCPWRVGCDCLIHNCRNKTNL